MPDRRRGDSASLAERVAFIEAWAEGVDRRFQEKEELDSNRHRENQAILAGIKDTLKDRDRLASESDEARLAKLAGIEEKLQKIDLQTARNEGAHSVWKKQFGAGGQVILAAISGGVLVTIGRYAGAVIRWIWPPPPHL